MPKDPNSRIDICKSASGQYHRNHPYLQSSIQESSDTAYSDSCDDISDSSSDCSSNYYQLIQVGRIELDLEYRQMQDITINVIHSLTDISMYFLEMACNAVLMRYAVRAMYYSIKNDPVNRKLWMVKCMNEFGVQVQYPTIPNLFGAVIGSLCLIKCGDFNSGIPYFSFALTMAKQLGINKETGLMKLTSNRQEREDCRNLWWFIHRYDQLLKTINRGLISDEDNGVYLPGTAACKFDPSDIRSLGLEIMSSKKLYTPTIPSQSVYVNRVLLARLLGQATGINEEYKKSHSIDTLFSLLSLKDSLFLWNDNLPPIFKTVLESKDIDSPITWSVVDTLLQYHFAMIIVLSPTVYSGIEEDYEKTILDPTFDRLLSESAALADLFNLYLNCNPKFKYTFMFVMNYAFHALIPQILLSKGKQCTSIINILLHALESLSEIFQLGKPLLKLAHRLLEMDNPKEIKRKCDRKRPCSRCAKAGVECVYPEDYIILTQEQYQEIYTNQKLSLVAQHVIANTKLLRQPSYPSYYPTSAAFSESLPNAVDIIKNLDYHLIKEVVLKSLTAISGISSKKGDFKLGATFFNYALTIAKALGVNCESSMEILTDNPNEAEDLRKLWWLIYTTDRELSIVGQSVIDDSDNNLYLPGAASRRDITSGDDHRLLGLEIMSCSKWYIPFIPDSTIKVYEILLYKVVGKVSNFVSLSMQDQSTDLSLNQIKQIELSLIQMQLIDSLFLWYNNLPSFLTHFPVDPTNPDEHAILNIHILYHYTIIMTHSTTIYTQVQTYRDDSNNYKLLQVLVGHSTKMIDLYQLYIKKQQFKDASIFHLEYLFQAAVPLILNSTFEDQQQPLAMLLTLLQLIVQQFSLGLPLYQLIKELIEIRDPGKILEKYYQYSFKDFLHGSKGLESIDLMVDSCLAWINQLVRVAFERTPGEELATTGYFPEDIWFNLLGQNSKKLSATAQILFQTTGCPNSPKPAYLAHARNESVIGRDHVQECKYPGDPVHKPNKLLTALTAANESVFINPINQLAERNWNSTENKQLVFIGNTESFDEEFLRIQNTMLGAMQLIMKISRGFLEKCCYSFLMQLAIRTFYYVLNGDYVNKKIWLDKCVYEFAIQLKHPSLPNLLGTVVLSLCFIKSGDFGVGIPYFSFAINSAKLLGINKETGLAMLTRDPQEKEDCRNLWWVIYRVDQFMAVIGKGILTEEDNGIYLPETASQEEDMDGIRSLGLEIMASKKWYTPIVFSPNIYVNKVLLDRLLGQAVKAHEKFKYDQSIDTIFALVNLSDSLHLWHSNLPSKFRQVFELLNGIGTIDRSMSWMIFDAYLQYYFSRIIVNCPLIYYNLSRDYSATIQSKEFDKLLKESKQLADIIQFYITHNPTFEYSTLFYVNYMFQALIPMLLKNSTNEINVLLQGMQMLIKKFQLGHSVYSFAYRLVHMDPLFILKEHSNFSFVTLLQHGDSDKIFKEFLNDEILLN
ncbi:hypothetical protein HDV06_001983 [Boothiomyces sp. JEL0866]|nr:hypothetical protein HDV06_001983 [Boothiomyces sp. JEL0866]